MPERSQDAPPSPEDRMRAAHESAESTTAKAFEQAVNTPSFGAILARSAENVAALSRIGTEVGDLVLRNLRIAGRADITRLARQLHRTEDKLERVLQEVEMLRDDLAARDRQSGDGHGEDGDGGARRSATGNGSTAGRRSSRARSERSGRSDT